MLYMVKKSTGYFFRLRLPKDVAGYFGRKEIIRSLRTSRYREAKSLTLNYLARAEKVFAMLRSGTLTDEMIQRIVDRFLETAYTQREKLHYQSTGDYPPFLQEMIQMYHQNLDNIRDYDFTKILGVTKGTLEELAAQAGIPTPDGFDIIRQAGEAQLTELKRERARNRAHELPFIKEMVSSYLKDYDLEPDEDSDKYKELCRELLNVEIQLEETNNAWEQGELTELDREMRQRRSCKTLSELIKQYEAEKLEGWADPSRFQSAHRQILHILGDIRLNTIDRAMLIQFREDLKCYPSHLRGEAFKTPWKVLSERSKRFLSDASQQFIFSELNTLLSYGSAVNMGVQGLPGKGLLKAKKDLVRVKQRESYSAEELQKMIEVLSGIDRNKKPDAFWIPLVLLYTGARSNDVCMLRCEDIEEHNGIGIIHFRFDVEQQQRTKSENDRQIPIHPHLIDIGFLEYVRSRREAGYDRLFPVKKYREKWNVYYGKAFNRTFKRKFLVGYTPIELSAKDLHTFRKTLIEWYVKNVLQGDAANFIKDLATLQSMIGHLEADELKGILQYIGKSTITIDLYGGGLAGNTAAQVELIKRLDYGIDLSALKA